MFARIDQVDQLIPQAPGIRRPCRAPFAVVIATLALFTVAMRVRADDLDLAGARTLCTDGREHELDILCRLGQPASTFPYDCEATVLASCSMAAPGFAEYSCRYPDGMPPVAFSSTVAWTTGELTAQPAWSAIGGTSIAGITRRERGLTNAGWRARRRELEATVDRLGCERGAVDEGSHSVNAFYRCGRAEIRLYGYFDGRTWSRTLTVGTTPLFDCTERTRREPRFGTTTERLDEVPLRALERRCRARDGAACGELASRSARGVGVRRDLARSLGYSRRGCELGDVSSCNAVGFAYDEGRGVARDTARALEIYEDACARGSPYSCARLAQASEQGLLGRTRDAARARRYYEQGCTWNTDHGYMCRMLGLTLRDGLGGPIDRAAARSAFDRGCTAGDGASCNAMCSVDPSVPGCEITLRALERLCGAGDASACGLLCGGRTSAACAAPRP